VNVYYRSSIFYSNFLLKSGGKYVNLQVEFIFLWTFMNRYIVFLCFFFASWSGYAQQKDTLKVNPVSSEQQKTFIGPPPERSRPHRLLENGMSEAVAKDKIVDEGNNLMNQDSLPTLQVSDRFVKELKAASRIYHKKTTVDDSQTLANPHISLSFDDILCFLFRPDLREKMKNKKRLKANKSD